MYEWMNRSGVNVLHPVTQHGQLHEPWGVSVRLLVIFLVPLKPLTYTASIYSVEE